MEPPIETVGESTIEAERPRELGTGYRTKFEPCRSKAQVIMIMMAAADCCRSHVDVATGCSYLAYSLDVLECIHSLLAVECRLIHTPTEVRIRGVDNDVSRMCTYHVFRKTAEQRLGLALRVVSRIQVLVLGSKHASCAVPVGEPLFVVEQEEEMQYH